MYCINVSNSITVYVDCDVMCIVGGCVNIAGFFWVYFEVRISYLRCRDF